MPITDAQFAAIAAAVDEDRVWQLHEEFGRIGGTPRGGLRREALTDEDISARVRLAEIGEELGCTVEIDPIGNMFLRRPGTDPEATPVGVGSHLDSQPTGGRFDGPFGVLSGLEAIRALNDAGIRTRRPIEVVNFTNEEGGRFMPGVMGSQVHVRPHELEFMLNVRDEAGIRLGDELERAYAAMPRVARRELGRPFAGFVEGHIEQATLLEETGNVIGVVTRLQGSRKFTIEVTGEEMHAGTTPRRRRKDALLAAAHMVVALERLMWDADDAVRFTIGRFNAFPGAPSVVPAKVRFSGDLRHPDDDLVLRLGDAIKPLCEALAAPCSVEVTEPQASRTTIFDPGVCDAIRRATGRLGLPAMDMLSGAGHDARNMAQICPTAMVFIPCKDGISHNEAEYAKPSDVAAGTRVIAQVVAELADA